VIPTLNAAATLDRAVAAIRDGVGEIVVADGGSCDGTAERARRLGARVVVVPPGRGRQLAAGIAAARGAWLLLLHADTVLAPDWAAAAARLMRDGTGADGGGADGGGAVGARAGYFRFRLDSDDPRARRLERLVGWRCRRLGLPYGDQALLLSRALLRDIGGMRPLPLMEDVDLARRIGRRRLVALDATATTSAARWERDGYLARSARNLGCLSLYFLGVPTPWIARLYR
jgi:glycosyltransferase involved in cell wall biosynthesis